MLNKSCHISTLAQRAATILTQRSFSRTQQMLDTIKTHQVNNLERRFLVWTGKYKSQAEVPDFVSQDVMERCRNKVRIRIANIMIGLTALGCVIMVYSGKEAAKRGESVTKQNLEWHKQFNELSKETAPKSN
ncbi:UPF0389 protein CG9231 [Scaptodrosophila lebanonensis]|uniref:UPF0389 protein CG9231 n=1 Tax=Drosophila lebanonensis TaxID=7225 RepID=A0A6J2UGC1_DROLE|nr:UPF0389 protein CG9231 [Scaptodrosophila lebanonensis]